MLNFKLLYLFNLHNLLLVVLQNIQYNNAKFYRLKLDGCHIWDVLGQNKM